MGEFRGLVLAWFSLRFIAKCIIHPVDAHKERTFMHGIVDKNGKFTISYLFRRLREKPETCASGCFLRCVKSRVELFAKKATDVNTSFFSTEMRPEATVKTHFKSHVILFASVSLMMG